MSNGAVMLAIDPGEATGFAVLGADGAVCDSGVEPRDTAFARLSRYRGIPAIIGEMPYYRDAKETPGDPNQLIRLGTKLGVLCGQLSGPTTAIALVLPHDWKGRISKEIHHNRFSLRMPTSWAARWPKARLDERDALALLHWAATKAGCGLQ